MMMNKTVMAFLLCVITAVVMMMNVLAFAGDEIVCPPRLTVQHDITGNVPDDWQKHDDRSSHPFVNVMFSEGSPDLQIILAPIGKKKVKGKSIAEWEFPKSAVGYWVSCLYNNTSATIARKLPEDVAYCEVQYDKAYSSPHVERWRCLSDAQLKQRRKEKQ